MLHELLFDDLFVRLVEMLHAHAFDKLCGVVEGPVVLHDELKRREWNVGPLGEKAQGGGVSLPALLKRGGWDNEEVLVMQGDPFVAAERALNTGISHVKVLFVLSNAPTTRLATLVEFLVGDHGWR